MASRSSEKKLVRSKSGLRIVACHESNRSPFELCEPPWISDNECSQCRHCLAKFDFMKRRHHCRRCGAIFCSSCCCETVALPRMCFVDPVRVCAACADLTRKENEFYDKHLKTLTNGASFLLSDSRTKVDGENNLILCKLSADHRCLVFESDCSGYCPQEPLELSAVQNVRVLRTSDDYRDSSSTSGLLIRYEDDNNELCELTLTVGSGTCKVQATTWIVGLLKATKMMFEARGFHSP